MITPAIPPLTALPQEEGLAVLAQLLGEDRSAAMADLLGRMYRPSAFPIRPLPRWLAPNQPEEAFALYLSLPGITLREALTAVVNSYAPSSLCAAVEPLLLPLLPALTQEDVSLAGRASHTLSETALALLRTLPMARLIPLAARHDAIAHRQAVSYEHLLALDALTLPQEEVYFSLLYDLVESIPLTNLYLPEPVLTLEHFDRLLELARAL